MKIRILDDSVRLRLDRTEVERLGAGEAIACRTHFPDGSGFGYSLASGATTEVAMRGDTLFARLHVDTVQRWAADESEVSISTELALTPGVLHLLVEKDFECLAPRDGENQSNRFPNPGA